MHKPQINFHNSGFTLVEISIVMIIIGLLIGGVFGGMRLIDIATANGIASQLKSIESSALTFRSTYGRLPGDLRNPNTRLTNCANAPCSVSGNGNGTIGTLHATPAARVSATINNVSENYTFWHQLTAADLVSLGITNSNDMSFGVGTPESSESGVGYRVASLNSAHNIVAGATQCNSGLITGAQLILGSDPNGNNASSTSIPCRIASMVDKKIDDGFAQNGAYTTALGCLTSPVAAPLTCDYWDAYASSDGLILPNSVHFYDFKGF